MKKQLTGSAFLSVILLSIAPAWGQVYRMQGRILLSDGSAAVAGSVRMMKYPGTVAYSTASTLDANGRFDISYNPGYPAGLPPGKLALVYYATGETTNTTSDPTSNKRIFEIDWAGNVLIVSPASGDVPFLRILPIPSGNSLWCGLNVKKSPGVNLFEFDGGKGWCPEEYEKLNSIVSQSFPSGNLVSNGSFEDNYQNGDFPHWNTIGLWGDDYSAIHYPMGNLRPRSGRRAAAIRYTTLAGAQEQAYLRCEHFRVKPNTQYLLVFYYSAKEAANWGTNGVRPMVKTFSEKNGPEVFDMISGRLGSTAYALSADTWLQYYHTFQTGPSAVFASLELLRTNANPTGGTFYFDDVMVVEANVVTSPGNSLYQVANSVVYTNGMNKPIQARKQSGSQDIYTQTENDELHRGVKSSLPIGGTYGTQRSPNGYLPDVFTKANTQYNGASGYPNAGGFPFSETKYETSPLGRPVLSSAPGFEWRAAGTHTMKQFYSSTADLVPTVEEPTPAAPGVAKYSYALTRGEHSQTAREFTDKFGRTVRKSSWMRFSTRWADVEYEYDPNGFLSKITAPPGPGGTRLVTLKKYNTLGQLLSEDNPAFGENLFMYDAAGRLRFTQSRAQRNLSPPRMDYIKYDKLSRIIETGEYLDAASYQQPFADESTFPDAMDDNRAVRTFNFYDRVPEDKKYCPEDIYDKTFIIRDDASPTNPAEFKTWDEAYTAAYVDLVGQTTFTGKIRFYHVFNSLSQLVTSPFEASYPTFPLYGWGEVGYDLFAILRGGAKYNEVVGRPFPYAVNWGPLNGRLVQSVSCNTAMGKETPKLQQISTTFNYDKYGNVTDLYEFNGYIQNTAKQWQKTTQTFNAQNRLLLKKIFTDAAASAPEVSYAYFYNNLGLLDEIQDKAGAVVAKHTYNSIGQLTGLNLGQGTGQVRTTYTYHVRGWLKKIEALSAAGTRLFLQELKYEDGTLPRFDGSISEYNYALTTAAIDRFQFSYGDLDRLVSALTTVKVSGQIPSSQWDYTYADNSVLTKVRRLGQDFNYVYDGANHLKSVTYAGTYARNTNNPNNFSYDGSGRMDGDISKQMSVAYSSSDLPYKFTYTRSPDVFTQFMIYDASGMRRSKLLYKNGATLVSSQHYTSTGKEIREFPAQAPVEIYPFAQFGRVVKNASGQQEYEATIKNHLGSTAKIHNITRNAESYRTDYEPFGKLRAQTVTTGIPVTDKFTGKEHDEGIDLAYFGARYFDEELGMWISPDPLRQYHSPYDYCGGNPTNCVDKDGRAGTSATRGLWTINRIEKTVYWEGLGGVNIFKDSRANGLGEKLWWSKDQTGHGGSVWKVFREKGSGLEWVADADEFGDFIKAKHKGSTGEFIPWKETSGRANPSGTAGGLGATAGILGFLASFTPIGWMLDLASLGEGAQQMAGPAGGAAQGPSFDPNCLDLD
jgi:RHS repeat-associated protein